MSSMSALRNLCAAAALLSLAACAPTAYVVKAPSPSGMKYEAPARPPKTQLSLVDKRAESERVFHSGRLAAELSNDNAPINPPRFLAANLQAELASRGIPVQVAQEDKGLPRLNVTTFRVINHRATGFSPFVTFTYLAADIETPAGKQRVGTFIKRGKVPVWSFDEIVEPTLNQPLSLAVKELASKVANQLYGYRSSDKTVDELVAKINNARGPDTFLDVYALGFTNNPRAVDPLTKLVRDGDENVRLAAVSSLGNLRATSQFNLLKSLYENRSGIWQDRAMAIKAIGDLGTEEAKAYLARELKFWQGQSPTNEAAWTMQVIRLYI